MIKGLITSAVKNAAMNSVFGKSGISMQIFYPRFDFAGTVGLFATLFLHPSQGLLGSISHASVLCTCLSIASSSVTKMAIDPLGWINYYYRVIGE